MRISDWSSDVCSSDLGQEVRDPWPRPSVTCRTCAHLSLRAAPPMTQPANYRSFSREHASTSNPVHPQRKRWGNPYPIDRKSVVTGKRVSVRVDHGGSSISKKKTKNK